MAITNNIPVSEILRSKASSEDEPKKKSREDWRKAKELEEARKAGTAPAAVDEEGKDINPHIPQYISAAPWYFGNKGPTLKHQRIQDESIKKPTPIDLWYKRGVNTEVKHTKYRKGACENCGAVTHQRKDCMERPRKVGAKFTNTNIAPDEFVQPVIDSDFDAKRDRWAGYDPSQHKAIVEQYNRVEEAKRQLRAEKLGSGDNQGDELDDDEDEDKYVDEVDMPGTKVDSKQRITVRNLRIREDTAKYLRNLDPSSAYYDPKTRSMRDDPHENTPKAPEEVDYSGENFVRFTGDTRKHAKAQLFAWEAYEKGVDVHLLAEPTKLELLQKDYEQKKEEFKHKGQMSVLEQYGGAEHLEAPPKQLLLAQTEDYVEYSRYGKVVKGQEKSVIKSKYEEDVLINNHTSVWGSYWHNGAWGYKCCHSFIKESYCTGEAGKSAAAIDMPPPSIAAFQKKVVQKKDSGSEDESSSSSSSSSSDSESDSDEKKKIKDSTSKKKKNKKKLRKEKLKQKKKEKKKEMSTEEKLKAALKMVDEEREAADRLLKMDERKRPYNSMFEVKKPSDEDMEAYYMKRKRDEDPMAFFQS